MAMLAQQMQLANAMMPGAPLQPVNLMNQSFQKRGGDCISRWEGSPNPIGSDTNYQYYTVEVREYYNSVCFNLIYFFHYWGLS
eukprot:bmy_09236T0